MSLTEARKAYIRKYRQRPDVKEKKRIYEKKRRDGLFVRKPRLQDIPCVCPVCTTTFSLEPAQYRQRTKNGAVPCCSRSCARFNVQRKKIVQQMSHHAEAEV